MTLREKPILHGRDHMPGGVDPIPGMDTLGGGGSAPAQPGHRLGSTEDRWYIGATWTAAPIVSSAVGALGRYVWPLVFSRDSTLDRIGVDVAAGVSGKKIRYGLYSDGGNLYPDALLFDSGDVSVTTSGGKTSTISIAITKGTLYWVAFTADDTTISVRGITNAANCMGLLGSPAPGSGTLTQGIGWAHAAASFGAFPNPYSASATVITLVTPPPCVFVRGT